MKVVAHSSPPVPAKLREILKDYPGHIEQLQKVLNSVMDRRIRSIPPFEAAVWLLEDHLSGFISEARAELATADASGNPEAIAQAQGKVELMFFAGSGGIGLLRLDELRKHFDLHAGGI
ncbi:hypothetical protein [Stenotrophomonas maltophilia]|nr:hypothetical protein [Stenotrophomonas maltophilia]MDT3472601.1 hypothetical protein [Stenotrophomonas maltophilia]